jgi:hypothetical protein
LLWHKDLTSKAPYKVSPLTSTIPPDEKPSSREELEAEITGAWTGTPTYDSART